MEPTEVKLDWMPITWEKLLAGTHDFDAAELGGYILLIARQWEKGSLPDDEKRLMKIARLRSKEKMKTVLEKFVADGNGSLINKVCDETRKEQTEKYLKNSSNGKLGAKKRWRKDGEAISPPISVANVSAITDKKKEELRDTNVSIHQQHTNDDFSKMIFSETHDLDRVNIELQLTPKRILHELDIRQFNAHLHTKGKIHETFEEWKEHLRNWLNTKPKHKNNFNATGNNQNEQAGNIGRISKTAISSYLSRRENNGDSSGDIVEEGTAEVEPDRKRA